MTGFWSRLFGGALGKSAGTQPIAVARAEDAGSPAPEPAASQAESGAIFEREMREILDAALRDRQASELSCSSAPMVTEHPTFPLAGTADFLEAAQLCTPETTIAVAEGEKGALAVFAEGIGQIGRISPRHPVARALAAGDVVLHASINSFGGDPFGLRLRVVTGPAGAIWSLPAPSPSRTYPVSLVGEQYYAGTVAALRVGDEARIWREPDNPYDALALAVSDAAGRMIGYVPKDCFLQRAIHDEEKACRATIGLIAPGAQGFTQVCLDVELVAGPTEERKFEG